MKRIIALVLVLALSAFCFVGCKKEKSYSLAIGVATTQSGASVTNTVAALVIDEDGKIVSCRIDCIDVKAALLEDGSVDASKTYTSKSEQGDAYDSYMPMAAGRWYQQAQAFESYVTGKTQADVSAIALGTDGKTENKDLIAGCTIAISDFVKAVENAFKSAHKVSFKTKADLTVGVAVCADVAQKGESGATFTADFAATVIADGTILASVIDSNEVTSTISDGEFGAIVNKGTKLEQGDAYDSYMPMASGRWYQQVQAFASTAVGKTPEEVKGLAIENIAGCSIYAGGYKNALEKAASYAR